MQNEDFKAVASLGSGICEVNKEERKEKPKTYRIVIGSTLERLACNIVQTGTLGWVVGHIVDTAGWDMYPTIW
jgi:hypothetical protein